MTKLLIGILYCGENEFGACIESINGQTYKNFEYFVIKNLPNKEAHDTLYQNFMDSSKEADLFLKIDADMVLTRSTFFEEVILEMNDIPDVDNLQIAVLDYFTNSLIYGLHIYRNTVTWDLNSDESVFVDRIEKIRKRKNDKQKLAPAAYHCFKTTKFYAYHFGIHKGVKIIQEGQNRFNLDSSIFHYSNILKTYYNYLKTSDTTLLFVLAGFCDTINNKFNFENVNYGDQKVLQCFEKLIINEKKILKEFRTKMCLNFPLVISYDIFVFIRTSQVGLIKTLKNILSKKNYISLTKYLSDSPK